MSEPKLAADAVAARRRLARDAERTCRLLREYAGKLHRLADQLHALGGMAPVRVGWPLGSRRTDTQNDTLRAATVVRLLRRRVVISGMVEDTCRAASGMIEAALPLAVKSELLLRLRETENALDEARQVSKDMQQRNPQQISESQLADVPIPDLAAIERRRKAARDAADAKHAEPAPAEPIPAKWEGVTVMSDDDLKAFLGQPVGTRPSGHEGGLAEKRPSSSRSASFRTPG